MMKPDTTEKIAIPEISALGFCNAKECKYGRNQYQTPTTHTSVQTMDAPTPQYQAERMMAAQEVRKG
jgi:hypothetical protein